jgi:DNA-binding beta-propeller fold protein YncE
MGSLIEMQGSSCMNVVYHILMSIHDSFSTSTDPNNKTYFTHGVTMNSVDRTGFARHLLIGFALIQAAALALPGQQLEIRSTDYPTLGNPTSAVVTRDGRSVFVSVTNVGAPNFSGSDQAAGARTDAVSGIQIFQRLRSSRLRPSGFIRTGSTGANGLVLLNGDKTLAVGVGDAGVAFLDVREMIQGTAKPKFATQGEGAGTFDVVASPDGRFVFSSNEYGIVRGQRGSIGIIAVNPDAGGRVTHPQTIGQIPVGDVVPSLALSPDGSRVYVATELVPSKDPPSIAGAGNPILTKNDCVQKKGSPPRANGFITVIDARRATEGQSDPILARVAAGCSPVRLIESADSSILYASARGDDAILAFVPRLLESDPEHALLRALPSGGRAPVGMRLFDRDGKIAVANSNRFAEENGTVAILDVAKHPDSSSPLPLKILPAGGFPRNIGISHDDRTLYLTNYRSRSLQVLQTVVP